MTEQDVYGQLRSLTERQREVLSLVCEGKEYKEVGEELFITENAVKAHMANIYEKLGLIYLSRTPRKKSLFDTYCPALKSSHFEPSENEPTEPETASEEAIKIVEEDERALMVVEPEIIDIIPPEKPKKKKRRRNGWKWILALIIIALLTFGGFKVYEFAAGFIGSLQIQASPAEEEEQEPIAQVIPTNTTRLPEPTTRPTNTVFTPIPQPTRTQFPKVSLPFNEDFSNGINSPWTVGYGNWFVTDSGASISISDLNDDSGSIVLDDPTLTDYKVKVKVHTPHMWSANQGQFGVIVRYGSHRDQNIIFYMDSNGRFKWSYIESLSELSFYQPPVTGVDKDAGSTNVTLEIEVIGNTFIAKVNGGKIDQFSMAGYERGGVVLVTKCGNVGSCPSFSDLSIEPTN
jgi:DNA-binding CsgD family transcriptional regulator